MIPLTAQQQKDFIRLHFEGVEPPAVRAPRPSSDWKQLFVFYAMKTKTNLMPMSCSGCYNKVYNYAKNFIES